jgi:hypothetical protein
MLVIVQHGMSSYDKVVILLYSLGAPVASVSTLFCIPCLRVYKPHLDF